MKKFIFLCVLFAACESPVFTPKPKGYPKVSYPVKEYQIFDKDYCHFTFQYPQYAVIKKDSLFFEQETLDPCWFDIVFPTFNGRIHCSYYPINKDNSFDKLMNDAFELVNKHTTRADFIDDFFFQTANEVSGFGFDIKGPAASPFQFFLTDSTQHFLRGSLYFNTQARPDSLAPIYDFVKKDILYLINTFKWNENVQID